MTVEAYELACDLANNDLFVTCIPVVNEYDEEDVAVVALQPNVRALVALHMQDTIRRRAIVAIAIYSHRMLKPKGLTFRCHSSS
jgi:hypothetical protein